MTKKFVLIGAKPPTEKVANPGGQLTASIGIVDYIESLGFEIQVIDTTQSSFPVPPLKERLVKGLNRTRELIRVFKNCDIDGVIIFSSSGFSFYERILQSLICKLFNVPDVFFVRSGHFMNSINKSSRKRFIAKILLNIPNRLGVQGKSWISFYEDLGLKKEKCILARNWLQPNFPNAIKPRIHSETVTLKFVFVGWLVKEKGIIQLLEAFKRLTLLYNFELHLVGGGDLESFCTEFKNKYNLGKSLYLHGWQDKDNVIEIVNNSDVFVLPSEAEGFPNALLEAIALGLPAICTDVGGISDSLLNEENGFLLASNNSELIYSAMKKYLDTPSLINDHSKASLELYRHNHDRKQNCEVLLNNFING